MKIRTHNAVRDRRCVVPGGRHINTNYVHVCLDLGAGIRFDELSAGNLFETVVVVVYASSPAVGLQRIARE